jgi:hypothetical protein
MRKTVQRFHLILILATILCLVIPLISNAQQLVLTGNIQFLLAENQPMQAPDGILVKDNAENYLPTSLILSNGDVVLNASTAKYIVHSVPASADAVFYSALPAGNAGLTVQNGASTADYTLMLEGTSSLGSGSLPVIWEVSRSGGMGFSSLTSDYGNLTFSWDAALEPTELSNKKLYVCSGDARGSIGCAWTALPLSNTTPGSYSLTYTGLTMPLSATRFAVATGLSAASTPTQPICTGGTGSVSIAASGGLGSSLQYKLGTGSWQSGSQFTGLTAGTYTIYVKDDLGEEISIMATLTDPPPVTANVTGNLSVCPGQSTTLTVSGGVSYSWSSGLGTNAAVTVAPISTTTYSVTSTDANSCIATASVTVSVYVVQPPVVTFSDISGASNNDGTICAGSNATVVITGGASYAWRDGASASSRTFVPACNTTYTVTVTDANGCTITTEPTISVNYEPTVEQITPSTGSAGTVIHIYGTSLANVQAVTFNGQTASGLNIISNTHITANLTSTGAVQQVSLLSPCGTKIIPVNTPVITSITPGAGSVGTAITLTGTNLDQLTAASVGGVEAVILSRAATSARIIVMPGTATGTISVTSATATGSAANSFTVTPTLYPYFQQGAKFTSSSTNAIQGSSVSVSADGNTAIIGAPGDNSNAGAAWVYTRSGTTWTQQAKLVGTGNTGAARQGSSVSLSADGNTAVIGGPADNTGAGAVWVFTRSGSTWTQQGDKLTGTGAIGAAQQGIQVAVSGDGNTIASGGFADDAYAGAVWTFVRYGTSWAQLGDKLIGSGAVGKARQGSAVSLNQDGSRLLEGGYQDNNRQGAAWIYERTDCGWMQQGLKLVGTGGTAQAWQGYSVSLSADGNTAVSGGSSDNSLAGAAWVYTYAGGAWTQQTRLVGTQAAGAARQGTAVTLSADGNTIMVGGQGDDSNKGAVWVYKKSGPNWTQQGAKIKGSNATGAAKQGSSVSVSATGHTSLIGGPTDNTNKGAFWVYVPATTIPSLQQDMTDERQATEPGQLRLDQNVPNPATGRTVVSFCLPEAGEAEWTVTDMNGRVVQSLKRIYPAGENTESFELAGYTGVYSYSLRTGSGVLTKIMVIVR